ncbi:glucoamylase family protein [Aquincola sp. MAHUQ-54]|uniref:Glucoamylase family protein n=1 Tax=Aquincola agrisoli TaxID=3119538 RepID=A0AAW9QFE8_9BURK
MPTPAHPTAGASAVSGSSSPSHPSLTRRRWLAQAGAGLAASTLGLAHGTAAPATADADDLGWLDELEARTFRFFWETTDAATGLTPDRWPGPGPCSVAAMGFALSAYAVGIERGFVTREAAAARVRTTLQTLHDLPQGPQPEGKAGYKGFFYHFLDMRTGLRTGACELSTVDTALLLAGALHCQQHFDRADPVERRIRDLAQALYERVDWRWAQVRPPSISHGWQPEIGFLSSDWKGYNEAMIVYLLALGSPTFPVEPAAWSEWLSTCPRDWGTEHGQTYLRFPPLFGHQFTHCWVDFRGLQDAYMREQGIDYFENSRRATLAQQAYAVANPNGWAGYGAEVWGVTASDGPANVERPFGDALRQFISYAGRGMGGPHTGDDGTIAPYGAGASIVFAPDIVVPTLKALHDRYGEHLIGRYGFYDAFNLSFTFEDVPLLHGRVIPGFGWVASDYLGIDQGPFFAMLGNHRGELIWRTMRKHPALRLGLLRAGFRGGWLG